MRRLDYLAIVVVFGTAAISGWGNLRVTAAEVLVNGDLDSGADPPSWTISTYYSDDPGTSVGGLWEHNDGSNSTNPAYPGGGLGLVLHPQKGNQGENEGLDRLVNFVMEQTFNSAIPGRKYTLQGDLLIQHAYSGVVENLTPLHPLGDYNNDFTVNAADYTVWRDKLDQLVGLPNEGPTPGVVDAEDYTEWTNRFGQHGHDAIASPTVTKFEMTFLNSSGTTIESHEWDVRNGTTLDAWRFNEDIVQNTSVNPAEGYTAPAGTAKVRVRVSALDMQDNCCDGGQDVLIDNVVLHDQVAVTLNRLANGNLNTPGAPIGWTLTEGPTGTIEPGLGGGTGPADSAAFIDFANRRVEDTTPPIDPKGVPTGPQGLWLRPFVNETQFDPDLPDVFADLSQVVPGTPGATYAFSAWSAWEFGYCGGFLNTTTETYMKIEFLDASNAVIGTQALDLADAGQVNDDSSNLGWDDWRQFSVMGVAPANTAHVRVSAGATGMFNSGINPQSAFFDEFSLIETLPGAGALAAVPEPGSTLLLTIALGILGVGRRGRN